MAATTAAPSRYRGRGHSYNERVPRAGRPYSRAEHAFVRRLNAERAIPAAGRDKPEATLLERNLDLLGNHATFDPETDKYVSSAEAGQVIDYLQTLVVRPDAPGMMETGIYRRDGILFLVKWNEAHTRTNAYELTAPAMTRTYREDIFDLAEGEQLPAAEAGPIMARMIFKN